jgi:hypothetical protein
MHSVAARMGGGAADHRGRHSTPPRRLRRLQPGSAEQGGVDAPAGAHGRSESICGDDLRLSSHSAESDERRSRTTTNDYFEDILVQLEDSPTHPPQRELEQRAPELDEQLNRLNLSLIELPGLEEVMQEHLQFWRMRNLVLTKAPGEIVQMLKEAERHYRLVHGTKRQVTTSLEFVFDENGVNTADPIFGWNIGMHAAALGRTELFREVVDLGFAKDDEMEEKEDDGEDGDGLGRGGRKHEAKGKSRWQPPFMLDVGHKSFRRFSVRELYRPQLESARRQGVSEEELRTVFQAHELSGYMHHATSGEKKKTKTGVFAALIWHDVVFPRGVTALYIAKLFAHSPKPINDPYLDRTQIQQDIEEKMAQAIDARRRADELMSLGYIDEAASSYSECMQRHNIFADAASSLMLLHLNQREQIWNMRKKKQRQGMTISEEEGEVDEQRLQSHYREAFAAFHAWRSMDSDLFSLGVEKSSLLFRAAVSHVAGTGNVSKELTIENSGMTIREFEGKQEAGFGTQIHVRGVGVHGWDGTPEGKGAYESKAALIEIFNHYGKCLQATIRHRIEGPSGKWDPEQTAADDWPTEGSKNTSWALITMQTTTAVNRAIKASETKGVYAGSQRLTLTRFDKEKTKQGGTTAAIIAQTADDIKQDRDALGGKIRWQEMEIATELMVRLGPIVPQCPHAKDILDFTLQDSRGRTLKWLLRYVAQDESSPFKHVPDGVSSSVPFFLEIIPNPVESLTYAIWPLFLVGSCLAFYVDLALDFSVCLEYYEQGTEENTAEPEKLAFFWVGVGFYANGVLITCLFDMITTFVSEADRRSAARRRELAMKCVLNILQIRMPYECYQALQSMKETERRNGQVIDRTARMPPMTLDQTKCAEGVFEALPQSMLQAFVVINDMMKGRDVTVVQAASLLTSYGNVAVVLGLMGPPDITISWRVIFMTFVVVNVVLRSISFSFLAIMLERTAFGQELGPWATVLCLGVSYLVTLLFVFGLQRKKIGIPSFILSIIAFMCAVDISQFTVLKTAQPMTAQLPFAIVRYLEICIICYWYASYQEYECLLRDGVQAIDILRSDGSRNVSVSSSHEMWQNGSSQDGGCLLHLVESISAATSHVSCHKMELDKRTITGNNRWVFFDNPAVYGRLSSADVAASALFPFNVASVLSILIMLNIITYVLCNVIPYKMIDSTPKGLRRLWEGSEVKSLTKCCVSNTAFRKSYLVSSLVTIRDALMGSAQPRQEVKTTIKQLQSRARELHAKHRATKRELQESNALLKIVLAQCNPTEMNVESPELRARLATFGFKSNLGVMLRQDKLAQPEPEPEPAPAPAPAPEPAPSLSANHPEWARRAQKAMLYRASSRQRWDGLVQAAATAVRPSDLAWQHSYVSPVTWGRRDGSATPGPALAAATERLRTTLGVAHDRRAPALSVASMDIERPLRLRAARSTTTTAKPRAVTPPRRHTEAPLLSGTSRRSADAAAEGAAAPAAVTHMTRTRGKQAQLGSSDHPQPPPRTLVASPARVLTMLQGHDTGTQRQHSPLPRRPAVNPALSAVSASGAATRTNYL